MCSKVLKSSRTELSNNPKRKIDQTDLCQDATLQAEVWLALWQADDMKALDISDIDVTVQQCEVWLAGKVEDAQALQLAECLVKGIEGVSCCHNMLITKKAASF